MSTKCQRIDLSICRQFYIKNNIEIEYSRLWSRRILKTERSKVQILVEVHKSKIEISRRWLEEIKLNFSKLFKIIRLKNQYFFLEAKIEMSNQPQNSCRSKSKSTKIDLILRFYYKKKNSKKIFVNNLVRMKMKSRPKNYYLKIHFKNLTNNVRDLIFRLLNPKSILAKLVCANNSKRWIQAIVILFLFPDDVGTQNFSTLEMNGFFQL